VSGYDPVTQADRAAERAIIDIIRSERPLDAIEGEETGSHEGSSGSTWHLDPSTEPGPTSPALTSWTTLIGLVEGDRPKQYKLNEGQKKKKTLMYCCF
jgi:myo-inositol-1(or 4)-monophosphatase